MRFHRKKEANSVPTYTTHHQDNKQTENLHKTLKSILKARVEDAPQRQDSWIK